MSTDGLGREAAELFTGTDMSGAKSIRQLAELAARQVPACSGATASLWRGREALTMAASHPDLAELTSLQIETRSGPVVDAAFAGEVEACPDTLADGRWPEFATAALSKGVRCCCCLVHDFDDIVVVLTLYSVRPNSLDPDQLQLASLLAAFGAASVANASRYGEVQRTASQLQEALDARAMVDQAKGILMHALKCDADEAFERLRRISQTQHIKLTEVARQIVQAGGPAFDQAGPTAQLATPGPEHASPGT